MIAQEAHQLNALPWKSRIVNWLASPVRVGSSVLVIAKPVRMSPRGEDRGERADLEDTWSSPGSRSVSQSPVPQNDSEFRINDRRATIPQWLLLFLILQGGGIIWWAATMQSDLRYQEREKIRLEQMIVLMKGDLENQIKTIDLLRQKDADRLRDLVRDEVANQLLSRGVVRIQPTGQQ